MWARKENEDDAVPQVATPADSNKGNLDDYSWNDEDEYPEIREYREIFINSPAYAWLASTLTAELQHETLSQNIRAEIHQTLVNMLDTRKVTISRRVAPPTAVMRFHLPWNMPEFFRYQDYGVCPHEALPRALVLSGVGNNIQCSTITEYISQVWPYYGPEILKLYQRLGTVESRGLNRCQYPAFLNHVI